MCDMAALLCDITCAQLPIAMASPAITRCIYDVDRRLHVACFCALSLHEHYIHPLPHQSPQALNFTAVCYCRNKKRRVPNKKCVPPCMPLLLCVLHPCSLQHCSSNKPTQRHLQLPDKHHSRKDLHCPVQPRLRGLSHCDLLYKRHVGSYQRGVRSRWACGCRLSIQHTVCCLYMDIMPLHLSYMSCHTRRCCTGWGKSIVVC
jgi:hypothetical protein